MPSFKSTQIKDIGKATKNARLLTWDTRNHGNLVWPAFFVSVEVFDDYDIFVLMTLYLFDTWAFTVKKSAYN